MLDCWMSLDVAYGVQLAESLRPLRPRVDRGDAPSGGLRRLCAAAGRAYPGRSLATGEHWYTPYPLPARGVAPPGGHPAAGYRLGGRIDAPAQDLRHRGRGGADRHSARRGWESLWATRPLRHSGDPARRVVHRHGAGRSAGERLPCCRARPCPRMAGCAHPTRPDSAWRSMPTSCRRFCRDGTPVPGSG